MKNLTEATIAYLTEPMKIVLNRNRKVKQDLHKLIDGLDVNAASKFVSVRGEAYGDSTIESYSTVDCVKHFLKACQKPKEKTLEQKLIDAGFEQSKSFNSIYAKNKINIWLAAHNEFVETSCGADRLRCNLNDHAQIFADIAYLESKIK